MGRAVFSPRGRDCYASALSNLLLNLGDAQTAKRVFENYPNHPMVNRDLSMHVLLATRVLSELTEGRYQGRLALNASFDLEEATRKFYDERRTAQILKTIKDEEGFGRIYFCGGVVSPSSFPVLIDIVKYKTAVHDWKGECSFMPRASPPIGNSWIVSLGEDRYIDDGCRVRYRKKDLHVTGLMEVYRT